MEKASGHLSGCWIGLTRSMWIKPSMCLLRRKVVNERKANLSKDDPEGFCLPPGVPRYTGTPYPFQILQMPDKAVILYEGASHMYRTIYMDGRKHTNPDALNP